MTENTVPLNDQTIRWAMAKLVNNTRTEWSLKGEPKEIPEPLVGNTDHVIIRELEVQESAEYQIGDCTWDYDEAGITIYWTEDKDPEKQYPRRAWREFFVSMDFGMLIGELTSA